MNGRVEVCLNGDWGTVCHDHWSTLDTNVACRQLGYSGSGMYVMSLLVANICESLLDLFFCTDSTAYFAAQFGQNSAIIIALDNVACTAYESRLIDCPYDSHVADCTHSQDAGMQCAPCEFHSHRLLNRYLQPSFVFCTVCSHGSIRLRNGSTMSGRVEVCLNGDWGTVCDDGWTAVDANVACGQLGYSRSGM